MQGRLDPIKDWRGKVYLCVDQLFLVMLGRQHSLFLFLSKAFLLSIISIYVVFVKFVDSFLRVFDDVFNLFEET